VQPKQIGVPDRAAMDLTFPEYVTALNVKRLHDAILTGAYHYPGANYVTLKTGAELDLQHIENRRTIRMEDVLFVKRHLRDGDVCLVNRQPTLHRNSQMALKAKITPNLHVASMHHSLLAGFGADFDGDEINIHILQTVEAAAEALLLASPETSIMKDGKVWINFIQNTVVAAYHMTLPGTRIYRNAMTRIVSQVDRLWFFPRPDGSEADEEFWLGKTLVSLLLPEDFCLKIGTLEIIRGTMLDGTLNADRLSAIVATMVRDYADRGVALRFIHEGYLMFQAYLDGVGLSVGYFDCAMDPRDADSQETEISSAVSRVKRVREVQIPTLSNLIDTKFARHNPRDGDGDTEACVLRHIEFVTKSMSQAVAAYHAAKSHGQNGLLTMIDAGAKGSLQTLNAMSGAVCSILLSSKRMDSASSHYPRNGTWSLQSAGFISENYSTGVSLLNVLTESHPSGESVVSKNKGTSKSGYIVRKLASCMMGIVVDWKHRVVDTNGRVLWDNYGDDNYDSMCLMTIEVRDEVKKKIRVPIRLEHVVWCAKHLASPDGSPASDIGTFGEHTWNALVSERLVVAANADMHFAIHHWLSQSYLEAHLGVVTQNHLDWITAEIRGVLQRALIPPGDSVGIRAVQDAGEHYVQLCLKTPHLSGKFGKMTSDTARIADIVDSNFHNPGMTVVLKRSLVRTKTKAIQFGLAISRCTLSDICAAFPTITGNLLTFEIDKQKAIYRTISMRKAALRLSTETGIPLTCISTSFADEAKWWLKIDVPPCVTSLCHAQALVHNLFYRAFINGIPEIETFMLEVNEPNAPFVLTTQGSNLRAILTYPEVNAKKTLSSDCAEMGAVFGLHAALKSLEHEFTRVMAGTTDDRHIKLIARKMVADLELKGMKIKQAGQSIPPLMRACYEEGPKQMTVYCSQSERDYGSTVASAALANNLLRVGTGFSAEYIFGEVTTSSAVTIPKIVEYVASPKVDGTCAGLVFKNHVVALVTRDFRAWNVSANGLFFDAVFAGTSLTGDLVQTTSGLVFVVYDCEACCGNSLTETRYDLRLEVAREVVYRLITCNTNIPFDKAKGLRRVEMCANRGIPIARRTKTNQHLTSEWSAVPGEFFFGICVKPVFDPRVIAQVLPHFGLPTDGVVFTSLTHNIAPFRTNREAILKWKPTQSIDVSLKLETPGFYAMFSSDERRVDVLTSDEALKENTCYECAWIKGAWRVIRTRNKAPNTWETISAILEAIRRPMSLAQVVAGLL
jgi:DNA-directed RNA polymerase subunit A'